MENDFSSVRFFDGVEDLFGEPSDFILARYPHGEDEWTTGCVFHVTLSPHLQDTKIKAVFNAVMKVKGLHTNDSPLDPWSVLEDGRPSMAFEIHPCYLDVDRERKIGLLRNYIQKVIDDAHE